MLGYQSDKIKVGRANQLVRDLFPGFNFHMMYFQVRQSISTLGMHGRILIFGDSAVLGVWEFPLAEMDISRHLSSASALSVQSSIHLNRSPSTDQFLPHETL